MALTELVLLMVSQKVETARNVFNLSTSFIRKPLHASHYGGGICWYHHFYLQQPQPRCAFALPVTWSSKKSEVCFLIPLQPNFVFLFLPFIHFQTFFTNALGATQKWWPKHHLFVFYFHVSHLQLFLCKISDFFNNRKVVKKCTRCKDDRTESENHSAKKILHNKKI